MKSDKTTSTESNMNEADNYSEIRTAEDAQNVEVGDTLSVEINAYAERDDRDEAFHAPQLIDGYELEVTDISEGELVAGGRMVTITLRYGDEITITSDGVRELKRDYEYYSNRDRHNPENRVRIDLLTDSDDEPEVVTDGGVDDSHFEHTCAGLSADNTPCRRGVKGFDVYGNREDDYCNDHEWQAKFDWEDYITQILPNNQTKRIHVTDVNKTETEWGPVLEIETQYGSVRVSSDEQIESGCVYDMTVKRSRTDWNQLVLYVKQVEDDD